MTDTVYLLKLTLIKLKEPFLLFKFGHELIKPNFMVTVNYSLIYYSNEFNDFRWDFLLI